MSCNNPDLRWYVFADKSSAFGTEFLDLGFGGLRSAQFNDNKTSSYKKLVDKTIAAVVVLKQAPYMYKPVLHSNDLPLKKTKKLAKYSFTSFITWILVNSLAVLLVHLKKGSTSTFWYSGYDLLKKKIFGRYMIWNDVSVQELKIGMFQEDLSLYI